MTLAAPTRLTASLVLGAAAALVLAGCGASFDSGVASPTPSTRVQGASSPSPSPTASGSACVNPATTPSYNLAGARTLAGNLEVKDLKIGTGAAVAVGNTVQVNYVGSLPNGTVFDNSANDNGGKPITLTIAAGKVIQGWVEGIPGMKVGGERELVIPPALGYGCTSPSSKIPVNSTLIFTITLVAIG
jgi:ABC-type phosphate transport system substrate-binding protein